MGQTIVQQVVNKLTGSGIQTVRGFPTGKMPALEKIQAVVTLARMDQAAGTATVLVSVCYPAAKGGSVCEDAAQLVCVLLREMGGQCIQSACRQIGYTELLCVEVSATFFGYEAGSGWTDFSVTMAGAAQACVRAVKVWRSVGDGGTLSQAAWEFQIEETMLPEASEGTALAEPFTMTVTRGGKTEVYSGCRLTHYQCELESGGLRRIRQGTAESRTVSE